MLWLRLFLSVASLRSQIEHRFVKFENLIFSFEMNFLKYFSAFVVTSTKFLFCSAIVENCGRSNSSLEPTQSSEVMEAEEFPWLVGIHHRQTDIFLCNGHLISSKHVLVSSECLESEVNWRRIYLIYVIAGQRDIKKWNEKWKYANLKSIDKVKNKENLKELLLLTLIRTFELSRTVQPICLNGNSCDKLTKCSATLVSLQVLICFVCNLQFWVP